MLKKYMKFMVVFVFFVLSVFVLTNSYAISYATEPDSTVSLKSLTVNQEGISPEFNKDKTNYSLFVKTSVNEIKVTAVPEDSTSSVTVTGNTGFKDGDNIVEITVTSKTGKSRIYTIIVTKTDNKDESNSYLQNLILENINLSPDFESEILEYDGGKVASDVNEILVFASPAYEYANVEVIGNKNLVVGENEIKVIVNSENMKTKKTYLVNIEKIDSKTTEEVQNESIAKTETENEIGKIQDDTKTEGISIEKIYIGIISLLSIIVISLVVVIIKLKK